MDWCFSILETRSAACPGNLAVLYMRAIAIRRVYERPLAWTANEVWLAEQGSQGLCACELALGPPYPQGVTSLLTAHGISTTL